MVVARVIVVFALLVSFVACTATERPASTDEHPTPTAVHADVTGCEETFSSVRCVNMVDYAAAELDTSRDEVASIEVLPPPTPELIDGVPVINLGGATVDTLVRLHDGSVHEVSMHCGGISPIHCRDDPQLQPMSPTLAGYWDVPCSGEPPHGCASPVPPPDPEAIEAAQELRVPHLDIPIDHDGQYEVPVGEATLPNGILSVAEFGSRPRTGRPMWPSPRASSGSTSGRWTIQIDCSGTSMTMAGSRAANTWRRSWSSTSFTMTPVRCYPSRTSSSGRHGPLP